jgi:hypothetical protein
MKFYLAVNELIIFKIANYNYKFNLEKLDSSDL